jgi:hypothetical protein
MHSIGFRHEQKRSDRDTFITVAGDNTCNGQYNPKLGAGFTNRGSYNYESLLHYSPRQCPGPSGASFTVVAPKPAAAIGDPALVGQRDHWSAGDTTAINAFYP